MHWGTITWYLFHSLAEKANSDSIVPELVNNICLLCGNLPCPLCTEHAADFISKSNFQHIKTREQLISALHVFHNHTNRTLNKPHFAKEQLSIYKTANVVKILRAFFSIWEQHLISNRAMMHTFYRKRAMNSFHDFINNNIRYFM